MSQAQSKLNAHGFVWNQTDLHLVSALQLIDLHLYKLTSQSLPSLLQSELLAQLHRVIMRLQWKARA